MNRPYPQTVNKMNLRSGFNTTPEKRVWYPIDPSKIPRKPTRSPIDFSKMPKKPVSLPIVFQPTADEKINELLVLLMETRDARWAAAAEIEALKKSKVSIEKDFRDHMNERTQQISDLLVQSIEARKKLKEVENINESLKAELEDTQKRCNEYENRANQLYQKIRDPFKSAPASPF